MKIINVIKTSLFLGAAVLVSTACEKQNAIKEAPANSIAYYAKNPVEAKQVAEKCLTFERNEFSTMSPSKQKAWGETSAGINCDNAKQAYGIEIWNSRHRAMAEANKKFK